jgi:hypothetical protein
LLLTVFLDDTDIQPLEQLCNSLKEPEECDHREQCSLENSEHAPLLEETSTVADSKEETWLQLLGNDKLKKLVSMILLFVVVVR